MVEPLIKLIVAVASDSAIAKELALGKGKTTYTIKDLIREYGLKLMANAL